MLPGMQIQILELSELCKRKEGHWQMTEGFDTIFLQIV
jgi:hypothetical protein